MTTVAIDIDGTWTLGASTWRQVVEVFEMQGWRVVIVTGRDGPSPDMKRLNIPERLHIVFCGNLSKAVACALQGIHVDVWVDNEPWLIAPDRVLREGKDSDY